MKVALEKPGTPGELVHFGVKGMKWGVRKSQGSRDFKKRFPTSAQRTVEIHRARASVGKTKEAFKNEKDPVKRQQLKDLHLNNPDRATALRITKGEKVVRGLLYAAVPIPLIPAAVGVNTLYRVGKRRGLEN